MISDLDRLRNRLLSRAMLVDEGMGIMAYLPDGRGLYFGYDQNRILRARDKAIDLARRTVLEYGARVIVEASTQLETVPMNCDTAPRSNDF